MILSPIVFPRSPHLTYRLAQTSTLSPCQPKCLINSRHRHRSLPHSPRHPHQHTSSHPTHLLLSSSDDVTFPSDLPLIDHRIRLIGGDLPQLFALVLRHFLTNPQSLPESHSFRSLIEGIVLPSERSLLDQLPESSSPRVHVRGYALLVTPTSSGLTDVECVVLDSTLPEQLNTSQAQVIRPSRSLVAGHPLTPHFH